MRHFDYNRLKLKMIHKLSFYDLLCFLVHLKFIGSMAYDTNFITVD
ncbi:MAG: hypothetical protein ACI9ES_000818 [Oceanospirillaceae bacterium]|jgi:hypothetical protein